MYRPKPATIALAVGSLTAVVASYIETGGRWWFERETTTKMVEVSTTYEPFWFKALGPILVFVILYVIAWGMAGGFPRRF